MRVWLDKYSSAAEVIADYRRWHRVPTTEAERQANLDALLDSLGDDQ